MTEKYEKNKKNIYNYVKNHRDKHNECQLIYKLKHKDKYNLIRSKNYYYNKEVKGLRAILL